MPPPNAQPPEVMTWQKAIPVLIVAGIFDVARIFFEFFWFLGPALGAALCTATTAETVSKVTLGIAGVKTAALVCSLATGALGVWAAPALTMFGVVMSMAFGFAGFMILGLLMMRNMPRMLKANTTGAIWLMGSFVMSEIPFLGALPAFTLTLFKLYRTQIKVEKAAFKKFKTSQQTTQLQEQQQQLLQMQQQATAELQVQEEAEAAEAQAARDTRTDLALQRAELADQARGESINDDYFSPRLEEAA